MNTGTRNLTNAQLAQLEAYRIVQYRNAIEDGQAPLMVPVTPEWRPKDPGTDAPGFGAGVITALIIVGVFAVLLLAISRMDGNAIGFMLGTFLGLASAVFCLFFLLMLGLGRER